MHFPPKPQTHITAVTSLSGITHLVGWGSCWLDLFLRQDLTLVLSSCSLYPIWLQLLPPKYWDHLQACTARPSLIFSSGVFVSKFNKLLFKYPWGSDFDKHWPAESAEKNGNHGTHGKAEMGYVWEIQIQKNTKPEMSGEAFLNVVRGWTSTWEDMSP